MKKLIAAAALSVPLLASAQVVNGGFETGDFTGWTVSNGSFPPKPEPASVIPTPGSVYGEPVPALDASSKFALYFVQDGGQQSVSQVTTSAAGLYDWSVSYYIPANGMANPADAHLHLILGGTTVWTEHITSGDAAQTWTISSSALTFPVSLPANFTVEFMFSPGDGQGNKAKDIIVDNIMVTAVPEPESFALMAAGLAALGFLARRRRA